MRNQVTKIALATTLVSALIGAAPASAQHGQYRLATGHELPWPTANHAQAKQNYDYKSYTRLALIS
jgi:hypothetical protein